MDRDYEILREIDRWRYCLSRHLKVLGDFGSQTVCDRRLRKLREAGYIDRKRVIYGIPSFYYVTHSGKKIAGLSIRQDKIKLEQVTHDIAVLDTAIYFILRGDITKEKIKTEKELHQMDGFSVRKHRPDFVFVKDGKTYCVEVELTQKAKTRLEKNIADNFMSYDYQNWVVPNTKVKIIQILKDNSIPYHNIEIIRLEEVQEYVREYNKSNGTD